MTVADSEANLAVYSKQRGGVNGGSSYPTLRLLALVSCGTRTVIDAVFGPVSTGELTYAAGLLGGLHAGMILLADRNFGAGFLAAQIAATGADFLIRVRSREQLPEPSRPAAPARRLVAVALRRHPRPGHRRRDHRHHEHRECHGRLPAGHHPDRPGPLPRRRPGCSLPRALGATRSRLERVELAEGGLADAGYVVPGPVRRDCSRPGVRRG